MNYIKLYYYYFGNTLFLYFNFETCYKHFKIKKKVKQFLLNVKFIVSNFKVHTNIQFSFIVTHIILICLNQGVFSWKAP